MASVLLAAVPGVSAAQSFAGRVRGTVRDASGVVAGTTVRIVEENTELARATVSNALGEYVFPDVRPGMYRVETAPPGYKASSRGGVQVGTQAFVVIDIVLDVGRPSEAIVVTAPAPAVDTATASVSTLLDRATLDALPSAGRNVFVMATMTPTVIASGDSRFVRQQDQSNSALISIGGGPRRDNSYVLDGVPIGDIVNRASFIPSLEAVQELRVQIGPYDAEVGRTSGGVFNTIGRSGSNRWHGDGQYQDRPDWAQARPYFAAKAGLPAETGTYYHLRGGALGGPIVRNRTFFWASSEGYRSLTTRSAVLVLPTEAQRRGDFSQIGITIYDPLTTRADPNNPGQFIRDPFPNNQIPASRLNPVALALLDYLPLPTSGMSRPAVAQLVDAADQATGKVTHRWTDRITSTGLYAWYGSTEPDPRYFGQPVFQNAADPGDGALVRRVHMLAFNNTWTPGRRTVVEARYGFNSFLDDNRPTPFDPGQLGFAPGFLNAVPQQKFPGIGVVGYGSSSGFLGDRFQSTATYYSHVASAAVTTLVNSHSLKFGGEYRVTGVRFLNLGGMGGYSFSRDFTFGPDPNAPAAGTGDAFASFLLGYPSSGVISTSSPIDIYASYWSGFAQDDVRVTPRLTLTLGLRYEFEQGLHERHDQLAVGWAYDTPFPVQVGGMRPDGTPLALTGGLVYAGAGGAPTGQGDPGRLQFAPRVGAAYALDERTSIRAGYGLFWAPPQGISADEFGSGTRGYNQTTNYVATGGNPFLPCATCSLTNPFPSGFDQPVGNRLGQLTGVGGYVNFIDPGARMAHFHRYSIDVQRELPGRLTASVGYIGMRGEDLAGGASGSSLNINQLDPKYVALGTALQNQVPNPFYGTPLGVGILAAPTLSEGQLLRPYPQFDAVYATRPSVAISRYNALVVTGERRLNHGWSALVNYTWSRLNDSQYGESNYFSGGSQILNNYDVSSEYGLSVLDAPHRLNLTGLYELPFGVGRRWMRRRGLANVLASGWSVSAVGSYQSGFPVSLYQTPNNSNLLGSAQRPNLVSGVDPELPGAGSYDASCGCVRWLNPAAWSQAAPFTFGNAPRTDGRVRTPARQNWDLAIDKSHPVGGVTVAVRAEVINVFNTADLLGPDIAFGDPNFGQIRSAAGFPRMLQLSARVFW
ncbi:MAG TPA: TonB-dependent receptor [Vicinamibacterales bacterium]|nr:TonB-dependent receptor [Vicinamibacterales bacterium]